MVKVPCPTGHPFSASEEVKEFMSEMSFVKYSGSERRPHANSKEHEYLQINSLPFLSFS